MQLPNRLDASLLQATTDLQDRSQTATGSNTQQATIQIPLDRAALMQKGKSMFHNSTCV